MGIFDFFKPNVIPALDKQKYADSWAKIEQMLKAKHDSSLKQALMEADKLLALALADKRIKGETMGERLKNAKNLFDKNLYEQIWQAHKLRNRMVHEDTEILSFQIESNIYAFGRALKAIGAL